MKKTIQYLIHQKRKIGFGAFIFLGIAIVFNLIVINSTKQFIYNDINKIPKKEYALVLGTIKNGKNGINRYFKFRMEAAAELYFNGKVEKIIVSGDNHVINYDETTDMADYLIALGIPDSVIIRDYAGFRTLDSVIRAKKVFNCQELIIVSQEFHNQRALFIAKFYGIDAVAYNSKDIQGGSGFRKIREFAAKFLVVLDLYLFNTQPKYLGSAF